LCGLQTKLSPLVSAIVPSLLILVFLYHTPHLPSHSCCGCTGKVLKGEVSQDGAMALEPPQKKAGFALLCQSYPRSDLLVLTNQETELHLGYNYADSTNNFGEPLI
jgi:hypothetical protein